MYMHYYVIDLSIYYNYSWQCVCVRTDGRSFDLKLRFAGSSKFACIIACLADALEPLVFTKASKFKL